MSRPPANDRQPLERLLALDARTWAHTLAAIRRHADGLAPGVGDVDSGGGAVLASALTAPVSELATGPARRALSLALLGVPGLLEALRADDALPEGARIALARESEAIPDASGVQQSSERAELRDGERVRALRREVDTLRRQRDGAEARAATAESRAEQARMQLQGLTAQVVALEAEVLAAAQREQQSVARAERRVVSQAGETERALAAARRQGQQSQRELDVARATIDALRRELAEVTAALAQLRLQQPAEPRSASTSGPVLLPPQLHPDTTEAARWLLDEVDAIYVDAYNVTLNQLPGQSLEAQRRWLIDRLRPLVARGRVAVCAVFDGDRPQGSATNLTGLEVRFTGATITADDDIVFSVAASAGRRLVVTDDRELRARVSAEGANVIGGRVFIGALDQ
jgi:hypothetical protein